MEKIRNKEVADVFSHYPPSMRKKLMFLRTLVFEVASANEGVGEIEETLKWGEPSYIVKGGSTIRMDWKSAYPDQYAMYFNCNSKLVDTFREIYGDTFKFEGNRAIVFSKQEKIPTAKLKHCISLALTYHRRKNLPLLGA